MGQEGHSSEDEGVPVGDLMVKPYFIIEEFFHSQIEADKIVADQKMS